LICQYLSDKKNNFQIFKSSNFQIAKLKSLQEGIFINVDGRTEVAYQKQRMDDISMRQHDLDSKIKEATIREESLKKAVALEEVRYKRMSEATVMSPFNGVAWRVFSSKGTHVDTTRPLLELVDLFKCVCRYIHP